jgi:hypothetical protein
VGKADALYHDVLGLEFVVNHGCYYLYAILCTESTLYIISSYSMVL